MEQSTVLKWDQDLLLALNGSDSVFMDEVMATLTSGWLWIPLYLALFYVIVKNNETMTQIMLALGGAVLCILVADGVTDGIVKPLVGRLRPCNEPSLRYIIDTVPGVFDKNFSFFSAHAANICSLATFFSFLIRDWRLIVGLALWATVSCYTRLYLGMHYPSDILVGILFGGLVGYLSYRAYLYFYTMVTPHATYVSTQYTSTGYNLNDVDIILAVLSFLFLGSVFLSLVLL